MIDEKNIFIYQFIMGPTDVADRLKWKKLLFAEKYYLAFHPLLDVTVNKKNTIEIMFLGDVFDALNPKRNNKEILGNLISSVHSYNDFEETIVPFAGRYIIIIKIDNEIRVYPDTFGSKSLFYYQDDNRSLWIASQPQIIAEILRLVKNQEIISENQKLDYEPSYPMMQSPYENIIPLIPNHYILLNDIQMIRFWPNRDLPETDMNSAAEFINKVQSGIIEAALNRYNVFVTLTGGYDTRSVLGGCSEHLNKLQFITANRPRLYKYDIDKPRYIANRLKLNYKLLEYIETSKENIEAMERNAAFMLNPMELKGTESISLSQNSILFVGCGSELGRCWYYLRGIHPKSVSPEYLCKIKQTYGDKYYSKFISFYREWLNGIPSTKGVTILDLFFGELTMGCGASLKFTSTDICHKSIPAANCRLIIEKMLSVHCEYRAFPHPLHKKMVEISYPELKYYRYNEGALNRGLRKIRFSRTFLNKCKTRGGQEIMYLLKKITGKKMK